MKNLHFLTKFEKSEPRSGKPIEGTVILPNPSVFLFIWFNLFYRYVWTWAKKDAMQHDSFLCRKYSGTRGFPIQRKNQTNNFMAAVVAQNQYIWKPCPTKCRPEAHKDWEYCWWTIYQITSSTEIRIISWLSLNFSKNSKCFWI